MYTPMTGWERFWRRASGLCGQHSHVLITDISDYYNQIYHHTIENQLDLRKVSAPQKKMLMNLLANDTEGVSRGIPIGPHPSHLIAELAMIPIDEYIESLDLKYTRYVDDIHIFCDSRSRAQEALYDLVTFLDKTQKLQLNKQKTRIRKCTEFVDYCENNVIDKPINNLENETLSEIRSSVSNPYERIKLGKISISAAQKLSQQNIENILDSYISATEIDYVRLRWFIRRITQVGAPGGIPFIIKNFDNFLPAIADVARYLESSSSNYAGKWADCGDDLLSIYQSGIVQASEYLRVIILSLFAKIRGINHMNRVTALYPNSPSVCRRKILLAAAEAGNSSWLSGRKSEYKNSDLWLKRAAIYSMRALPKDERQFWLKAAKRRLNGLDKIIADTIK